MRVAYSGILVDIDGLNYSNIWTPIFQNESQKDNYLT